MSLSARLTDRVATTPVQAAYDPINILAESVRTGQEIRDRERNRGRTIGAPQLELRRQFGFTRPLDVFGVVLRSRILAAHEVNIIKAFGVATDT